ncbi:CGNR zinc finger domain-containing protein [Crossiella sp. S99.2]|uniref:CGNR zinc finger domain-containing protein n=1 Tax=Crossiella sp. S99.2 TaxID=2936272 RepID=UPI0027E5BB05|nr:CGNR zinc finger domain-containing protein [Crossiella sp. S99.2]
MVGSGVVVVALASTIRHDGRGGVADDLGDLDRYRRWLRDPDADELGRLALVGLRRAVRSLFAVLVAPEPPSAPDASRLLPVAEAVGRINAAVLPTRAVLEWGDEPVARVEVAGLGAAGVAVARTDGVGADAAEIGVAGEAVVRGLVVVDGFARAAVEFLGSAERFGLRVCRGPRCVKYYLRAHPRQGWCSPACGNRARVSRHYHRR